MPTDSAKKNTHAQSYLSEYRLDRDYFSECFDESKRRENGLSAYRKAGLLFSVAAGLSLTDINPYAPWFFLAMATVEFLSVRYQRSWWIARQMFTRAAGSQIKLTLSDTGISTENPLYQQHIDWSEISSIQETQRGFIIVHPRGRSYLSKQALSTEARDYMLQQKLS